MNIRRFTKCTFLLAIVALISALSACDQFQELLVPPQMETEGITVGVVLPLSGDYAATYGEPMLNGFELARQEINNSQAKRSTNQI